MADRYKKESTPPPLLLMPPGGGLTLTPPEQPNILMPVIQNQAQPQGPLLSPEEEAEADSFVGQTVAPAVPGNQPSYFQQPSKSTQDPFSQIRNEIPPATSTPAVFAAPYKAAGLESSYISSPSSIPPQSTFTSSPMLPPVAAGLSGTGNIYRQKGGRPQYVAPPSTFPPQTAMSAPLIPPSSQPPTAMVPPMPSIPPQGVPPYSERNISSAFQNASTANTQFAPPPAQHHDNVQYTGGLFFQPVRYHWCFREDQDGVEIWRPFSYLDSRQLEVAFNNKLQEASNNTVVSTNGGRYDVNVGHRTRTSVYWDSTPVAVRRCSWFFKREGDNRYIPYEEEFAARLEDEYKKAMDTNGWHRRLEFPGNIVIVMHNANVIVQFPASAAPDEWGNVQGDQMRPRVVKRGVDDFATIMQGERTEVEHLVFFVPGIEDMSAGKHKSVESLVDDFRSNALGLLESHFSQAYQSKAVNRVEFLPVIWTQALEDNVSGLKGQVESITLPSTAKLRHFINNSLVDTLFYTSPIYCQKICDAVGNEMNRMFHIFLERNQCFSGDVSVAGHSLGAVILFDLLLNQRLPGQPAPSEELEEDLNLSQNGASEVSSEAGEEKEEEEQTLEDLLSKIGLQDKANLFLNEQIDVDSLLMCTEQDLKDIGLQMGPRKKLLGFLNEEKMKKDKKSKEDAERKIIAEMEMKKQTSAIANHLSITSGSTITAQYLRGHFGAGQLKIKYSQLDFTPNALYALGSPIAVFLTLRGVQDLGEFFQLPTCPRVYNIFHPFDPMAFRIEPLIRQNTSSVRPVQVPHYKGRKRLHLEFKEAVTRYGTDIKQKIVDSFKSTWAVINDFARAHRSEAKSKSMEDEVKSEMDQMMSHIAQQHSEDDRASVSSAAEEEIHMGQLNEGSRVDYVLQEGPLESFNDYLFALASHSCYWESEDTALFMLKEIYMPMGIRPVMPGVQGGPPNSLPPSRESSLPPKQVFGPPTTPLIAAYDKSVAQPSLSMSPVGALPQAPTPPAAVFQSLTNTSMAGPPPPMFSPSAVPTGHMQPGARRSPYVPPDFSSLPQNQVNTSSGAAPLPPMGPQAESERCSLNNLGPQASIFSSPFKVKCL